MFCYEDSDCKGYKCEVRGNPNFGITSFDNVPISMLNLFIIITLEGWTESMYFIRQAS